MYYTIYKTTNLINGKFYIGKHQTKNLDDGYMGSGKRLKRSIAKYGLENFKKEILYIFETEDEMNAKEKELVTEEFCQRENTYNLCEGGKGGFGYINKNGLGLVSNLPYDIQISRNKKLAESAKVKIPDLKQLASARQLAILASKEKYPNGIWAGKTHTETTKLKMKVSAQGKHNGQKNSQFGTKWITDGISNRKIQKDEILPIGWNFGRSLCPHSSAD